MYNFLKFLFCIVFTADLFIYPLPVKAQTIPGKNSGASIGLSYAFGTTLNRVGISASGYCFYDFVQLNLTIKYFDNFSAFGHGLPGRETQIAAGGVLGIGPKQDETNPFLTPVSNQMQRKYSFGYAYNVYYDQVKTSQRGGTIGLDVNKFLIITENDILAGRGGDKFRTGGLFFGYRFSQFSAGLNAVTWTGNTSENSKRYNESSFSRFGYKDISGAAYGKFSHGILSMQLQHIMPFGQIAQYNFGFDSEYVRNIIQNKIMHDMYFFPKKWNKARNPHLPMLDKDGNPYLFTEDQKIKPASFYINYSMNNSVFY